MDYQMLKECAKEHKMINKQRQNLNKNKKI